ncbi:hypothetical protein EV426DRAFT_576666 [Tirmania nivea]|nr:hypothetical protein EV426DRAFT_576666 [Tirmania nivea]
MCHFKEYFSGPIIDNPTNNSGAIQGCGHLFLVTREKPCREWIAYKTKSESCKITFEEDLTKLAEPLSLGQYTNAEVKTGPQCWVPGCWNAQPMTFDPGARIHAWGSGSGYSWEEVRRQGRYRGPPPPGAIHASAGFWSAIESRWMQRLLYMTYQLGKKLTLEHNVPAGVMLSKHQQFCVLGQNQLALTWQPDSKLGTVTTQGSLPLSAVRALHESWVRQIAAERAQALLPCPYICQVTSVFPRHANPYCSGACGLNPHCPCNKHGRILEC